MTTVLNNLSDSLNKNYDVFITSASYEERCLSIINSIKHSISFKYKLVSLSTPHKEIIKSNFDRLIEEGFYPIEVNDFDQVESVTNFIFEINKVINENPSASFLVDITTFTRQTLLLFFRVLRNVLTPANLIHFLYTPAKDYSIGLPYQEKWLTRGVLEVHSIFGYLGVIRPSRPYHLIILLGYEVERASSIIVAYEPSKITIGIARKEDSISGDHYVLNKEKFLELQSEFPHAELFEFSSCNVTEAKNQILEQSQKYRDYNVVLSPMNNKISTVSSALAAFENDEIQLAVAVPALYNHENYSSPGDICVILDMPEFIKP